MQLGGAPATLDRTQEQPAARGGAVWCGRRLLAGLACRRQIGVFGEHEDLTGKSYTGRELDALSQEEKVQAVMRASLFSRTEPGHKSQLVDLLQSQGLVVAMVSASHTHDASSPFRLLIRMGS